MTVKAICKELGVPQNTVYLIKTKLKDQGNILRKSGIGQPISKTTPTFVADLKARFLQTPNKTYRTKDLSIDAKMICMGSNVEQKHKYFYSQPV